MLQHLTAFDQHLFHIINHDLTNPVFNSLMPWLRTAKNWIPLYILIIVFCLWRYRWWGFAIIIGIALSAGIADFTSAHYYKQWAHRLPPCQDPVVSHTDGLRCSCGSGLSFPSTHATDHFAMAFFIIMVFHKRWKWIWLWALLWAASISFAQIYVGVHYPLDVFCGMLYGILVGWLVSFFYYKVITSYR